MIFFILNSILLRILIVTSVRNLNSDISQVFELDDILILSEAITALSGGDSKKKMGILSSAQSSVFLT